MNPHPTTFSPVGTVREPPVIRQKTAPPFVIPAKAGIHPSFPPHVIWRLRVEPYIGAHCTEAKSLPPARPPHSPIGHSRSEPAPVNTDAGTHSLPIRCPRGCGDPSSPPLPAPTCHSERSEAESRNLVFLRATPVPPLVFLIILPSTFSPYQHSYPPLPSFSFIPHMRKAHQPRCAQSLA